MSGLAAAVGYLTILPVPRGARSLPPGAGAGWFSVVGLGVGALVALVEHAAGRVVPGLPSAVLGVAAWKLLAGGLHLDGLADCLDGLAGDDPARRLAIMRDSRIGAFGALGLVFAVVLAIALVSALPPTVRSAALVVVPALGRSVPAVLARLVRPAAATGHGAAFAMSVSTPAAVASLAVALGAAAALAGRAGVVAAAACLAAGLAAGWLFGRRLGGITGDVLGAAVELGELAALLALVAWTAPR